LLEFIIINIPLAKIEGYPEWPPWEMEGQDGGHRALAGGRASSETCKPTRSEKGIPKLCKCKGNNGNDLPTKSLLPSWWSGIIVGPVGVWWRIPLMALWAEPIRWWPCSRRKEPA
jgi:hypothetical protein